MTGYLIRWLWIIDYLFACRFWNHIISNYRNDFGDDLCTPLAVSACHFSQVFVFTLQFASSLGQTWWEWNYLLRCRVAKIGINATPENRWSAKWRKSSMFKAFQSFVTQRYWRSTIFLSFLAWKTPGWLIWQTNVWDDGGLCNLAITVWISQFWRNGVFQKRFRSWMRLGKKPLKAAALTELNLAVWLQERAMAREAKQYATHTDQIRAAPFAALGIAFMAGGLMAPTGILAPVKKLTALLVVIIYKPLQVQDNSFFSPSEKCHLSL